MSVLHARIVKHGGQGQVLHGPGVAVHPYATPATPMVMPAAEYHYLHTGGVGFYQSIYPSVVATGDPNAVPYPAFTAGATGGVVPAGRP